MSLRFKYTLFIIFFVFINIVYANEVSAKNKPSKPKNVTVTNVSSDRFTLSWTTAKQQSTRVNYGTTFPLDNTAYDKRGKLYDGKTHYIIVAGLSAGTPYYCDINSGGALYDNHGKHYTVTTGPVLPPVAGSDIVYEQVFLKDGTTHAEGAIVYIRLKDHDGSGTSGDSQPCSSLVDNNGYWYLELKNVRTQDLESYFNYSKVADRLIVEVESVKGKEIKGDD